MSPLHTVTSPIKNMATPDREAVLDGYEAMNNGSDLTVKPGAAPGHEV